MRVLICAATALAVLTGCQHQPAPAPTPTVVMPSMSMPATDAPTDVVSGAPTGPPTDVVTFATPPAPDAGTRAAYLADLNIVDTNIVHGDDQQAVDRGIAQCAVFEQFPDDYDRSIGIAHERFTNPNDPNGFSLGDTEYILQTIHKYLCPDYPYPGTPVPAHS